MNLGISTRRSLFLQATYDKLKSEVPKYKMVTTSILSDRLKVRASQACPQKCTALAA